MILMQFFPANAGRIIQYLGPSGIPMITPGAFIFDFTKKKTECDDEFYMLVNSGPMDFRSVSEFIYFIVAK